MHYKHVTNQIVKWLIDRLDESKQDGFVVGLSGGVDSGLVATLCAETGKPTYVVCLPHRETAGFQRSTDYGQALVVKYANVRHTINYISEAAMIFDNMFHFDINNPLDQLAKANMLSRLRMTVLYAHANLNKFLVVGTGNKVEDFGVYFYTKYGDGGVDISPIGDLLKSEVRALAKYMGVQDNIVNAVPTDELWDDDRSDEDQLGASYDDLEIVMKFLETGSGLDLNIPRNQKILQTYLKLNSKGKHKSVPIPICKIVKQG